MTMRRSFGAACAAVIWALHCGPAQAHSLTTGLATLDARSARPSYLLTLNAVELGEAADALRRAAAGDTQASAQLAQALPRWLVLEADGSPCRIARIRVQGAADGDARLVLALEFACADTPARIVVTDRWWEPFGEHHRTILGVTRADGAREERVLDRDEPQARFEVGTPGPSGFGGFVMLGVGHILSGPDHLLFLAALLIGTAGLSRLLFTVTAFTLAHSAALALAVLGWVHLSPAIVEPLIAASIVWVAVENIGLRHAAPWRRVVLAFGFGLMHGLAFSEALGALSLSGWPLARALFGFNLGVEIGQALVVLLMLPLIAVLSRRPSGQRITRWGSAAVGAAGLFWLVQRLVAT